MNDTTSNMSSSCIDLGEFPAVVSRNICWYYFLISIYNYLLNQFHITTKVVSSNPADSEVYSMQHWVITIVSDLRQVGGFSEDSGFLHQ